MFWRLKRSLHVLHTHSCFHALTFQVLDATGNTCYFTLELGNGWAPAILNSQEELDFILGAHTLSELQYYWIGGSADLSEGSTITYATQLYLPNSSGKHIIY